MDAPLLRAADLALVSGASAANLLVAAIMLARTRALRRLERVLGLVTVGMAFPAAGAAVVNALGERGLWWVVLPLPFVLHCALELVLDYVVKVPFRATRLLGPYLGIFYLGSWGMIGYSFLAGKVYGLTVLVTYFVCLGATWYSHRGADPASARAAPG